MGLALSGAGTILLALIFFYFPWQSFVVDQTRQRLFEYRDRWFDFSQKLISESDKANAAKIREELNYMIRLLHEFTVPVLAYLVILHGILGTDSEDGTVELDQLVNGFQSSETKDEAQKIMMNAIMQITLCMWRRSLLALLIVPAFIAFYVLVSATVGSAKSLGMRIEKLVATLAVQGNRQLVPKS